MKEKNRDSNIELLRMILIIFIIVWHLIVHGSGLYIQMTTNILSNSILSYEKIFIASFIAFPVNAFILISGFYGINLKYKKIIQLWMQCLFYIFSIMIIFKVFNLAHVYDIEIIRSFFPISTSAWWFISSYLFLMLLSPVLNILSDTISKDMFKYLILIGCILNCFSSFIFQCENLGGNGSNLINFIFIYFIGRYIKKYVNTDVKIIRPLLIYFVCSISIFILISIFLKLNLSPIGWNIFNFNNPLIIISAICVFLVFKNLKINASKIINSLSKTVFGVYLIHENGYMRSYIYKNIFTIDNHTNVKTYFIWLAIYGIIIFISCVLIEKMREFIFKPVNKLIEYIGKKKVFDKFKLKNI